MPSVAPVPLAEAEQPSAASRGRCGRAAPARLGCRGLGGYVPGDALPRFPNAITKASAFHRLCNAVFNHVSGKDLP